MTTLFTLTAFEGEENHEIKRRTKRTTFDTANIAFALLPDGRSEVADAPDDPLPVPRMVPRNESAGAPSLDAPAVWSLVVVVVVWSSCTSSSTSPEFSSEPNSAG